MKTSERESCSPSEQAAIEAAERIPGWLNPLEAQEMFKIATLLPDENAVCVEIGSWLGKSSVVLGRALLSKNNPRLYCIDLFDLNRDPSYQEAFQQQMPGDRARLENFMKNIRENELAEIVVPIQSTSSAAAQDFKHSIDLLFIDGDHTYPAVLDDFETWSPLLKEGGTIAFHDFFPEGVDVHAGPRMVIKEHIANNDRWGYQRVVDTLFIATKMKVSEVAVTADGATEPNQPSQLLPN